MRNILLKETFRIKLKNNFKPLQTSLVNHLQRKLLDKPIRNSKLMPVVYPEYEPTESYVFYVTISDSVSENSQKVSRSLPNIISPDKHLRDTNIKWSSKSLVHIPFRKLFGFLGSFYDSLGAPSCKILIVNFTIRTMTFIMTWDEIERRMN